MKDIHLRILKFIADHGRPLTFKNLRALLMKNSIQLKPPSIYAVVQSFARSGYITYTLGAKHIPPEKTIIITQAGQDMLASFTKAAPGGTSYDEIKNGLEEGFNFILLDTYYGGRDKLSEGEQEQLKITIADLSNCVKKLL